MFLTLVVCSIALLLSIRAYPPPPCIYFCYLSMVVRALKMLTKVLRKCSKFELIPYIVYIKDVKNILALSKHIVDVSILYSIRLA